MASLAINQNLLINYARPQLDRAKRYINQARSQANSLNIPSSFYYRNYLQRLAKSLLNVENDIKTVNNKISVNVDNINSIERKTYSKTSRISSLMGGLVSDLDFGKSGSTIRTKVNTTKTVNAVHAALEKASDRFDDALKKTSADVVNGINSLWASAKDFWNSVKKKAKDVWDWLKETGAKIGKTVSGWCKSAWDWISTVAAPAVWDVLKKTASLVCVFVQSVLSGLLQFGEAVFDLVCMVGLGIASIGTGLWDAGNAIYCAIADKEYKSATAAMWRGSMGFIAKGHVKSWFDALNNTAYGQWLNENSFGDWAKTDGIMAQIGEGIGYVAGVVILTIVTFGVGGVAVGATASISSGVTATTLAITAGAVGVSKYTAEAWNNNKLTVSDGTNSYDIAVDYEELSKLKNGQTLEKIMEYTDENGNVQTTSILFAKNEDGTYSALINGQSLSVAIDETGILEGLAYGGINGLWEFGQWYIGGKIGSSAFGKAFSGLSTTGQRIITSGSRIALDSVTGAVEVPFRSSLDMIYDDMTWEEAWNKNGGWNGVLSQTLIASIMSTGGEILPMDKILEKIGANKLLNWFAKQSLNLESKIKATTKPKVDIEINAKIDPNGKYEVSNSISKKYKNAEELYEAFVNKKTKMNMKEYVEAMDFFKVRDNISLKNKTGMTLEELFFDDDYVIGVHRAGNGNTQSILDNGLYLTGHQSSGAFTNDVKLERNITFHDDYFGFIKALAEGSTYKTGGVGYGDAIIVKIPKADINNLDKLVDFSGTTPVLKSDYIEGYITSTVDVNGKIVLDDIKYSDIYSYKKATNNSKKIMDNIDSRLSKMYDEGRVTGRNQESFLGYEEHNFVHVERVAEESVSVLECVDELIDSKQINGYAKIDDDIIYKSGLTHDLGMKDGGYITFEDGTFATIDEVANNFEKYDANIRKALKIDNSVTDLNDVTDIRGKLIRNAHSLNSSITVLQNKDMFGENAEMIACLDFIHSKSTSGVKHLTSEVELTNMVEKLYKNQTYNSEKIYDFDVSKIVECDVNGNPIKNGDVYQFKDGVIEQLRSGAVALRIGDAHAAKTGFNHGGGKIVIEKLPDSQKTLDNAGLPLKKLCSLEAEQAEINIKYTDEIKSVSGGDLEYSKQIILGERNAVALKPKVVDGVLTYTHKVKTANSPASTFKHGIVEKFGEYDTFKDIKQKVIIELPSDSSVDLYDFYEYQSYQIKKDYEWLDIEIVKGGE